MTEDLDKIGNLEKTFDLIVDESIKELKFKELNIKELYNLRELFIKTIKTNSRKEALEFAEMITDKKEKMNYLLEVANKTANISEEEINKVFDSVFGLIEVLKISSLDKKLDLDKIFKDNTDKCLEIYIFALGILTKDTSEEEQAEKF